MSASTGDDALGDGSAIAPFRTVTRSLAAADGASTAYVVLETGTYLEPATLALPGGLDVTLEGGFVREGAKWTRVCAPDVRDQTLISVASAVRGARRGRDGGAVRAAHPGDDARRRAVGERARDRRPLRVVAGTRRRRRARGARR